MNARKAGTHFCLSATGLGLFVALLQLSHRNSCGPVTLGRVINKTNHPVTVEMRDVCVLNNSTLMGGNGLRDVANFVSEYFYAPSGISVFQCPFLYQNGPHATVLSYRLLFS